jgi:transposase
MSSTFKRSTGEAIHVQIFLEVATVNELQKQEMKIRDDQWQELEPLLTGKQSDPGARAKNNRLFIEAVLWIVLNKSLWRHLPQQFGSPSTVYMRFRRWTECDFWRQLAQSKIEDSELVLMLEKMAEYGDLYTQRIEQRLARKAQKTLYKSAINAAKAIKPIRRTPFSTDDSTLHWVGLVTS